LAFAGAAALAALLAAGPALAILRSEVLRDAQSWVDEAVPYSQGVWGSYCSWDYCYEDPERGGDCYRSDCSGFVSATWGLPAPGNNTTGLCNSSDNYEISFDELEPGDALIKCSQHVMLFAGWIDDDAFEAYEEYTCGATAELRRHSISSLRSSGYIALRYGEIEDDPPPNAPPTGSLDGAGCTVSGWAQDPDAPGTPLDVQVTIGGPAGDPNAFALDLGPASVERADLCDALGSCNHGFAFELPPSMHDGTPRPVYVYALDANEGSTVALPGSGTTGTCERATPPIAPTDGVRRWVASPAVLEAWQWTSLEVAPVEDATLDAYPDGPALPDRPRAVRADDGSPEIWILDGGKRRHVVDAASLSAWRLDGLVDNLPAGPLAELGVGPDWPAVPIVVQGSGPDVYVIDVAGGEAEGDADTDALDGTTPPSDRGSPGFHSDGRGDVGGLQGGCSALPAKPGGVGSALAFGALAALLVRRRRRPATPPGARRRARP